MNDLFDKIEQLEQVPTALLTEITPATDNLSDAAMNNLTSHTQGGNFGTTGQQQPQQGQVFNLPGNAPQQQQQTLNAGNMLTPELAVSFFNILLPAAIVLAVEKLTEQRVVKAQFEATTKELEIIKPVLKSYLDSINFNVESPFTALIITVGFVYGSKVIEALNNQPKGTIKTAEFKAPVATPNPSMGTPLLIAKKPRPSGMKYNKKP